MKGLLLIAAVALAGCATPPRYEATPRSARSMVSIENHNWATVRVYLVSSQLGRVRLATVETANRTRVPLPRSVDQFGESVGFEVQLIGSGESFDLAPVIVSPGIVLQIKVENNLALSNIMLTMD